MTASTSQPTYSGAFNFAFVPFAAGQNQIDAGNISVVQNAPSSNGNNVVLTLDGHSEFFALDHDRIDNSNRGDYHIRAGGATNDASNGIFIATIASNGVDWGFNDEMEYGTASIGYRDDQSLFVSVNNSKGSEYNSNISAAYFDFTRFLGAWVRNDGRGVVTGGEGRDKIHVTKNADNTYTVKIDGVNSTEDGVLLVTGGENKAQYAAARALPDGSGWVIGVHNNTADGWAYENEDFGFTYIPKDDPRATVGRVMSDGSTPVSDGGYTITKIGTGEYKLVIPGHTPADGALVLSAEGLDGANMDNVVSYAPSEDGKGWIIQTRDFPTGQLEDAGEYTVPEGLDHMLDPIDPAYLGKPVEDIIASYEDATDNNVLVEAHRSNYYENGVRVRPENSLSAVDHALSLGVDILEMDFRKTSDGHWVIMHDESVNRTTNGSGNVGNMTLDQIRALNLKIEGGAVTDEKVPTAEEVFAAIKGKAMIDMDKVPASRFAELSALADRYGVADQLIFKTAINNDADIAAVKAALDACVPGTHFMALFSPNTTPEFAAKVFAAIHPDAVEFQVNPPADGWSDTPGPFFTDEMKAVFDEYDVRMFMNIEFAGQGNGDGSMSGGRGDFVGLTRPDLSYGYWADQGVSIMQTDEIHIAINYLDKFGYRQPVDGGTGTPGNDILVGTDGVDDIHGAAGDDVIQGLGGNDKLYGDAGNDQILGGDGDDLIEGGDGDDVLIGNAGDDQINGGDGNDQIDGVEGDDVLAGGKGSDTYVYASGYGSETIVEDAGETGDQDQLFLDDAVRGDVVIHRHGSDIEIEIGGETVTLKDQLAGGGVEVISFADGTTLVGNQIAGAAVNRGPVITSPATASGNEDTEIAGQITASDADADELTYGVKNGFGPSHGTVLLDQATGRWTYAPAANYNGADCFTVMVSDGHGGTVEQVIALSVNPVNDGPVVTSPATASGTEDTEITGQVVASDVDGDALSYVVKDGFGPAHGTVSLDQATGRWTYAPSANSNGTDHFTVVVSDGHGGTIEQVIDLTIAPVNDGPVAVDDTGSVLESESKVFDLIANDQDADGNPLSLSGFTVDGVDGVELTPDAAKAAFAIVNGKLAFTPGDLFAGLGDGDTATVTLSYTVSDGTHTDTGNFTLTVNGEDGAQNVIIGTEGSNVLLGTDGDDAIAAYGGADYAWGRDGADVIDGGEGNDYVFGGIGNDVMNGGEGSDTLFGDAGNDVLIGDKGNDRMTGGAGADTFMFRSGFGHDTVMDFGDGDVIDLAGGDFTDFADLADHLSDTALGAVLTLDDGSTLTLSHVEKADLNADHFLFAA